MHANKKPKKFLKKSTINDGKITRKKNFYFSSNNSNAIFLNAIFSLILSFNCDYLMNTSHWVSCSLSEKKYKEDDDDDQDEKKTNKPEKK